MLGRLIKQHSLSNMLAATPPPAAAGNYDDTHMRDILYALRAVTHVAAPDARRFRLVVGQDGGNLRAKQVLYDTDLDTPRSLGAAPAPTGAELADYMFGRGIPTNEVATATKVHVLYLAHGAPSLLVTKLFLLVDRCPEPDDTHSFWHPTAAWPAPDTVYPSASMGRSPSCRFSLGCVLPLDHHAVDHVLATVWPVLARHLAVLQKLVARKLVAALRHATVDGACAYVSNRRIVFPPQLLHNDPDIAHHTAKLARAVHYACHTPRLAPAAALMRQALLDSSLMRGAARFFVISWAAEVVNWLEFKDGRALAFLANLIAAVLPLRDGGAGSRVVVMTGNSAVAKRLVFILNGFFGRDELGAVRLLEAHSAKLGSNDLCVLRSNGLPKSLSDLLSRGPSEALPKLRRPSEVSEPGRPGEGSELGRPGEVSEPRGPSEISEPRRPSEISEPRGPSEGSESRGPSDFLPYSHGAQTPKGAHPYDASPSPIPIRSSSPRPSLARPISINATARATVGSSGSAHTGWEIPTKSGASLWASSAAPHAAATSLSATCLSSSLSLLSSSASNLSSYSLSKLGGSFVEKWKQLFSALDDDLPRRLSLKTPPALEDDLWDPPRHRLSRTQSMLNLAEKLPAHSVQRDNTAIYVDQGDSRENSSPKSCSAQSPAHMNQTRIRQKCAAIMRTPVEYRTCSVLNAIVVPDVHRGGLIRRKVLLPSVAFVDEFRPEFLLQSCPVHPKLEGAVLAYMKNEIAFAQVCGYDRPASRTVLVNLRAREAKLLEVTVDSAPEQDSKGPNLRVSAKKVIAPGRNLGDKAIVERVATQLRQLTDIVENINNGGEGVQQNERDPYNQLLVQTVLDLIR